MLARAPDGHTDAIVQACLQACSNQLTCEAFVVWVAHHPVAAYLDSATCIANQFAVTPPGEYAECRQTTARQVW